MNSFASRDEECGGPVLVVTPWYPPTIGGVAVVAERICRLLRQANVTTYVWVSDGNGASRRVVGSDAEFRRSIPSAAFYGLTLRSALGTLLRAPATLWNALRIVKRRRIGTVILMYPIGYAWPFVVLRWLRVIRLVSSCHGNEILKFGASTGPARALLRAVLRSSDAITVPAAHLIRPSREIAGTVSLPIWLIPNCVDDAYFAPRPAHLTSSSAPTLIHISAFTPRKRTLDIVEGFARAKLPSNARLIMVGEGPDLEAARELARARGVAERVEFVGAPADVRPYLWQSDVLVMASDEESGPLTLLEAMACEVPWIMTPWGIAMTLAKGEYGTIVPCRSPDDLARAMGEMLADRGRLRSMGIRGRQKVVEAFGEKPYLERHLHLLHAVSQGKGAETFDYSSTSVAAPEDAPARHGPARAVGDGRAALDRIAVRDAG